MKTLYVAWQDPKERRWYPVGQLRFDGNVYRFVYTRGAKKSPHFLPFGRMLDLHAAYESHELFPLFANRVLSKRRPEYKDFLHWLNLQEHEDDPLALLARTGGGRETDALTLFPCPEKEPDGTYHVHFFSHGIRYLPQHVIQCINTLCAGAQLFLMPDPQNPHDPYAVALRTDDPVMIVGYGPRYLSRDVLYLLHENPSTTKIIVAQVNRDAPMQLRLLCTMTALWPENFHPCSSEDYEALAS